MKQVKKKNIKSKEEKAGNIIAIYFLISPFLLLLFEAIGTKMYIIAVILMLMAYFYCGKITITKRQILVIGILMIWSLLSISLYSEHLYNWFGMAYLLFGYSLPLMFFSGMVDEWGKVLEKIENWLPVMVIGNIAFFIFDVLCMDKTLGNMEVSYSLLSLAAITTLIFFKNKKKKLLLITISSVVAIFMVGSRGPLLCYAAYVLLYLLNNARKNIIPISLLIIVSLFVGFSYNRIIETVGDVMNDFGISSRTLYKLQNGTITSDTGRSKIHSIVEDTIRENPIFGIGIGGDRIVIYEKHYHGQKDINSCYPHNIILEVLSDYGIVFGSLFLIIICILIVKKYLTSDYDQKNIILLLTSTELIRLLLSSSYIRSPLFFLLLGIVMKNKTTREEKNEDTNYITE